jgi:glycosyltransferase involved in cell wall biosynthesis
MRLPRCHASISRRAEREEEAAVRITFVLPDANLSGGVRVVAIYARRLKERGHQVTVVSVPPRSVNAGEALRRLVRGRKPWRQPGPSHMTGVDVEHRILERHRPVMDRDVPDADVVIATWWETAEWVAGLSERKGAKAYLIQHDETAMYPRPEQEETRRRVLATWQLPMYRMVVSEWLRQLAEERVGAGASVLVPNGVDLSQFWAQARGKQNVATVGVMYSTVHFKGCDISLAAIERARQRVTDLRVVAFGCEDPVEHLALPAGTQYTRAPAQDRIRESYAACDAWLVASRSEGFGLPLLEAMACRTPVIATPAGAAPELASGGGGVLVPHEDPQAMAAEIVRLAALSEVQWRAMSAAAYETARRHDWGASVELLEAALAEAVESRGAATSRSVAR